jgi:Phage Tail Collar Domain
VLVATIRKDGTPRLSPVELLRLPQRDEGALSWNTTGPQGPAGTTGIFGTKTNTGPGDIATSNPYCYIGQIVLSAGKTASPGSLPASGQTLPVNGNQALFAVRGTTYGGNGMTTFELPDLRKTRPTASPTQSA